MTNLGIMIAIDIILLIVVALIIVNMCTAAGLDPNDPIVFIARLALLLAAWKMFLKQLSHSICDRFLS